ncbi:hypothetical protein ACCS54_33870 [Rhizobium johnstonii]|uniref:hypothetical protein n=1 Tax=Rhizobium TaxID=379 RepID=UPI00031E9FE9|nr:MULTISPECIES: hypothetical protein [Rhizobium]MBB4510447.1 hypothetical protein [Rhizobium leguminosarum]MBY5379009.1 hypothetical protein [Rhizobium leguminosarum]MBY5420704.1 hypothetical protein [Rhizobium leguminosarum]UIK20092.1 hypothetical protein LZK79_24465 [Rhizobium leguminosarum]WSG97836.1 hypothetical protein U8P76_24835 [Rhizobium johnstonii]
MDILIAAENIRKFNSLLLTEKDDIQKHVLLELLGLEKEKLAAAIAAEQILGKDGSLSR